MVCLKSERLQGKLLNFTNLLCLSILINCGFCLSDFPTDLVCFQLKEHSIKTVKSVSKFESNLKERKCKEKKLVYLIY
ncbi:MAG: hypothetical protein DRP78_02085 [Candidatus Omnitrophota bacterium]|nr:MAG: hypothetical protein DRP78_02085 [Candidatus Omnitrophota bacterium]